MRWRAYVTDAEGHRTYGAPRPYADDAIAAFFEKNPAICTKAAQSQIEKWWSKVSSPPTADESQAKKQGEPRQGCALAGAGAQHHTLLLTVLHTAQFSGKHSPSLLRAADVWAMLQAYLALDHFQNCGHLFIILHQVFVPQGVESAVHRLIEAAQSGKNLARYAVVRQALQRAHRCFQDPQSRERQVYDDEAALLMTGQYKSWCGFTALFGAHDLMQAWGTSWEDMMKAGKALEALRDEPGDRDAIQSALEKLKVLSGVGADYLGPHCLRTWLEIVAAHPTGPSVWGGLVGAGTSPPASSQSVAPASSQSVVVSNHGFGWEMWGGMSEKVRASRSLSGNLEPQDLAALLGAPDLAPRQLAVLHCEAMSLRKWWTGKSKRSGQAGHSLQRLLSFLECRNGCALRRAVVEETVLASKVAAYDLVYHSAKSLVQACFNKWGSWDSIPSRPSISPRAMFAKCSVLCVVTRVLRCHSTGDNAKHGTNHKHSRRWSYTARGAKRLVQQPLASWFTSAA